MAEDDKELKDQRVVTMMSPSELEAIDDWMFKNRIRSRGEAIRRLVQIGMNFDKRADALLGFAFSASKQAMQSGDALKQAFEKDDLSKLEAQAVVYEAYRDFLELTMDTVNEIGVVFATSAAMRLDDADLRSLIDIMDEVDRRLTVEGLSRTDRLAELRRLLNIPDRNSDPEEK